MRRVCRTFDQEISENVLAVQLAEAFLSSPDLRVLKNKENLKYYLAYHVRTPRDVLPELPAKIQKMVEYATKALEDTDKLHDRNILLEVCAAVAHTCRDPFTFIWRFNHASVRWRDFPSHWQKERYERSRKELSRDITIRDQLIAAISVGAHDTVAKLLLQVPASLPLGDLGDPMVACVPQDDQNMIMIMMKCLDQDESRKFKRDQVTKQDSPYSVLDTMKLAIMYGRLDMVNLLLSYLHRYLAPCDSIHFHPWIHYAVLLQHTEVLKALLQAAPGAKPLRVNSDIFEQGLKIGNPAIVSTMIKYGSMNLDSRSSQLSALSVSVRVGSVAAIRAVAEAGADIGFVMDRHRLRNRGAITPLEYAIHFKKYDAVVCLIECGAKVPPISAWPTSKKMRNVMQNAVTKQKITTK